MNTNMSNWLYLQRKNPCHPNPFAFNIARGFVGFVNDYLDTNLAELRLIYQGGVMEAYGEKDSWEDMIDRAHDAFEEDPTIPDELENEFDQRSVSFLSLSKQINKLDLESLTNQELFDWHKKYVESYADTYPYGEPLAFILKDAYTDDLEDTLAEKGVTEESLNQVMQTLTSPRRKSFVNKEELELARIAKLTEIDSKDSQLSDEVKTKLREHTEKYKWIPYDYGVTTWEYGDFKDRLLDMAPEGDLDEKIENLESYSKNMKADQKRLYDKHDVDSSEQQYFEGIRKLIHLNDTKKEVFTRSHVLVRNLQDEIADRLDITWDLLGFFKMEELKEALLTGGAPQQVLQARHDHSVLTIRQNKKPNFAINEEADSLIDETITQKEGEKQGVIDGQSASDGTHIGVVQVLHSAKEVDKISKGDILVTAMTSPDYVTGMKKAGAIITDEGGVTSHAAIVSRELEIPCVIGTQNATKILDNGDKVEVDADEGVVKILDESQDE